VVKKEPTVATVTISDLTLARLRAAAAARQVSLDAYLDEGADVDASEQSDAKSKARRAAGESIRRLASEIKDKATVEELIADKRAGHKY
jgi:hypothetical protein